MFSKEVKPITLWRPRQKCRWSWVGFWSKAVESWWFAGRHYWKFLISARTSGRLNRMSTIQGFIRKSRSLKMLSQCNAILNRVQLFFLNPCNNQKDLDFAQIWQSFHLKFMYSRWFYVVSLSENVWKVAFGIKFTVDIM